MKVFIVDGSGAGKYAIVTVGPEYILDETVIHSDGTSNELEYKAVIYGMHHATNSDYIVSDSRLVVRQLKGLYKVKAGNLKPLFNEAKKLSSKKQIRLLWADRYFTSPADSLMRYGEMRPEDYHIARIVYCLITHGFEHVLKSKRF